MKTTREYDELGRSCVGVLVEIEGELRHSTPHTFGGPGNPGYLMIDWVTVLEYRGLDYTIRREDKPDWFSWLDRVVDANLNPEQLYEELELIDG